MSDTLLKVTGSDCLNYIDRPIGLVAEDGDGMSNQDVVQNDFYNPHIAFSNVTLGYIEGAIDFPTTFTRINHDISKRKVGLVLNRYEDGGIHIALLGDERLETRSPYCLHVRARMRCEFEREDPLRDELKKKPGWNSYPVIGGPPVGNGSWGQVIYGDDAYSFDEILDFDPYPYIESTHYVYGRALIESNDWRITSDPNNTLHFGRGLSHTINYNKEFYANTPLRYCAGNLFNAISDICIDMYNRVPGFFIDSSWLEAFDVGMGLDTIDSFNQCAIPFNVILTESPSEAVSYLLTGTLPSDAFLYPLNWHNIPPYSDDVPPDDYPNDNKPNDTDRDITPNLPIVPTFTPTMLSNYNWYWLDVSQYNAFIQWFWNDIGNYNDFDDLIAKVEGLYNDVASAVLMCRFYPVELSWIGGAGQSSNIKVGMIEKSGAVTTINQSQPPGVREIGHVRIPKKYNSFCDLAPYTQLQLYLPFHGFIDLDIDIFMGHDIYVYGVYDYLSGTIQYLIYYDNEMLVNTVIAKMAVDIPITLQTKNDRDSAVFQNVSSVVGGLLGAGAGIMSGNPIGMAIGVTQGVSAINSANNSAPLNVKGTVGETGALYSPPQCAIILRRPTIQGSDQSVSDGFNLTTWQNRVGNLCGYGYTLQSLSGYTMCESPRITFKSTAPYQSEIDEIYDYLEKGVLL